MNARGKYEIIVFLVWCKDITSEFQSVKRMKPGKGMRCSSFMAVYIFREK